MSFSLILIVIGCSAFIGAHASPAVSAGSKPAFLRASAESNSLPAAIGSVDTSTVSSLTNAVNGKYKLSEDGKVLYSSVTGMTLTRMNEANQMQVKTAAEVNTMAGYGSTYLHHSPYTNVFFIDFDLVLGGGESYCFNTPSNPFQRDAQITPVLSFRTDSINQPGDFMVYFPNQGWCWGGDRYRQNWNCQPSFGTFGDSAHDANDANICNEFSTFLPYQANTYWTNTQVCFVNTDASSTAVAYTGQLQLTGAYFPGYNPSSTVYPFCSLISKDFKTTHSCPAYTATSTNNNNQNSGYCYFRPTTTNQVITMKLCALSGTPSIAVFNENGAVFSYPTGFLGCIERTFTVTNPNQQYTIQEGCVNEESCSAIVSVNGNIDPVSITGATAPPVIASSTPTAIPTDIPSLLPTIIPSQIPTQIPTDIPTVIPTMSPSFASNEIAELTCAPYTATNTANATVNYQSCRFIACHGYVVEINMCEADTYGYASCSGDTYLSVYNSMNHLVTSNDDHCGKCSGMSFIVEETGCAPFSIHQGCRDDNTCGGTVAVTLYNLIPTIAPTAQPTFTPTIVPSNIPTASPTEQPTFAPTFAKNELNSFACFPYTASHTANTTMGYKSCKFLACNSVEVSVSMCSGDTFAMAECTGDPLLSVYDSNGALVSSDDNYCGQCPALRFVASASCQLYTIREGCFGDSECGGTVAVSTYFTNPTTAPTANGF